MSYNKETGMYEGYIYKITNMINGRIYIGQTKRTIKERWKQHIRQAKSCETRYPFQDAIIKYGADKFNVEEIEKISETNESELYKKMDDLEVYYIKEYKSLCSENGYNIASGGATRNHCMKPVYCFDLDGNIVQYFKSRREAADFVGVTIGDISGAIYNRKTCKGYVFRNDENFDYVKKKTLIPIDVYSHEGDYIEQCISYIEAAKKYNLNPISVYGICNGRQYSLHGLVFRFHPDPFNKYRYKKTKKINLYKNGVFFDCFDKVKDVGEFFDVHPCNISDVLHGRTAKLNYYRGYGIYYANDPNQPDKTKIVA